MTDNSKNDAVAIKLSDQHKIIFIKAEPTTEKYFGITAQGFDLKEVVSEVNNDSGVVLTRNFSDIVAIPVLAIELKRDYEKDITQILSTLFSCIKRCSAFPKQIVVPFFVRDDYIFFGIALCQQKEFPGLSLNYLWQHFVEVLPSTNVFKLVKKRPDLYRSLYLSSNENDKVELKIEKVVVTHDTNDNETKVRCSATLVTVTEKNTTYTDLKNDFPEIILQTMCTFTLLFSVVQLLSSKSSNLIQQLDKIYLTMTLINNTPASILFLKKKESDKEDY